MKQSNGILLKLGTRRTKVGLFVLSLISVTIATFIGCKTKSQSDSNDDQKALVSLAKSLPTNFPADGQVFMDAGLDSRTRSVLELANIFMANRDWTESLPEKQLEAWQKSHPYDSPPVIIHDTQADAAYRLTQLGPQAKAAAPAMIQSLTNSEFLTHQWALHQTGINPATEQHADSMNRHWAIQVLQAIGSASPEVVPTLVSVLHDHNDGYEASEALIIISLSDTNVLPLTIAKLESDPDSPEAQNSVRVLNGIGAEASAALPVLIQLLEHTNACDMVVNTLYNLGSNAAPAVPSLLHYYDRVRGDGHFAQRKWVVITLGRIGPEAQAAVPILQGLQRRTYESFDAMRSLWQIDPRYTQDAIMRAQGELAAPATMLRSPACDLLGEIGPPAKSAVPLLVQKLDSPAYPGLAFDAAWALWRVDPTQKSKAVSVFENFYTNATRYPYEDLAVDAAGALWQLEPERRDKLRPAIVGMLKQWKDVPGSRHVAPEMKPLLPALHDLVDSPEYVEFRPWALLVMRKIDGTGTESWQR